MRARTTMVAVVVVGLVLGIGTSVFLTSVRNRIESSIADAAAARVDGIVAVIDAGALSDPLPGRHADSLGQVVDAAGQVVASDQLIAGLGPLVSVESIDQRTLLHEQSLFEGGERSVGGLEDSGPYLIIVQPVGLAAGKGWLIVAASLERAEEALGESTPLLGIGLSILLAIVGLITWILTGRALRPVEKMRAEAELISASALGLRLPNPGAVDEIGRLARTLNAMLDRLEASAVRQRRFVADASHELKSPLAALRTMVEVGMGAPMAYPELESDLLAEVGRMERMVADLLYLALHDESPGADRMIEVDLAGIVRSEAESVARRSGLEVDASGAIRLNVLGDPDRLTQLVRNLTDNAARHAASRIWLETAELNGHGLLTVSDDGTGIPEAERERVFDRFVRLDDSRARDTGGAGLGLAVARAIARSHRGDLKVGEPHHGGATLEARFPLVGDDREAEPKSGF
jgi:signal transduction histidine kinase